MSRIVFFGTPEAAVTVLERVASRVDLVVTMPDRPRGRSRAPQPPPVKERSAELGIPVAQPSRPAEVADVISGSGPFDLGIVVAYGMLLDRPALAAVRLGYVNLHFSILPRWRGAAPVQAALMEGDDRTGVSLMWLEPGLDTGPVSAVRSMSIAPYENAGQLTARLAAAGAALLAAELDPMLEGRRWPSPQPEIGATYAPKIDARVRPLDFTRKASALARQVRALSPNPGALASDGERQLRVLSARAVTGDLAPGQIVADRTGVLVGTGEGVLVLGEVQPAGGRVMTAAAWHRGHRPDRLT